MLIRIDETLRVQLRARGVTASGAGPGAALLIIMAMVFQIGGPASGPVSRPGKVLGRVVADRAQPAPQPRPRSEPVVREAPHIAEPRGRDQPDQAARGSPTLYRAEATASAPPTYATAVGSTPEAAMLAAAAHCVSLGGLPAQCRGRVRLIATR